MLPLADNKAFAFRRELFTDTLCEQGHGRELLLYAVQHPVLGSHLMHLLEKADILHNAPLFEEIVPLVTYEALSPLLEISRPVVNTFLENLCTIKLQDLWLDSPGFDESIRQPFIFRESNSNPSEFTILTRVRTVSLPKNRFYQIWIQERGDPQRIKEAVLREPERRREPARTVQTSSGEYALELERSELQTHPARILNTLTSQFQQKIGSKFIIHFAGEEGVDQGGLGRQFVSQLVAEIGRKMNFQKCENGLFRPRLAENSAGEFPPLSESDKNTFRELGQLMMFCLNAQLAYPLGMLFDQAVITAIAKWDPQDLEKEFEEIDLNKMLELYKGINRYIEDDMAMVQ